MAANFAMESEGFSTFALKTSVYRKEGTGVPSLNTVALTSLDEQKRELAKIVCNLGKCRKLS